MRMAPKPRRRSRGFTLIEMIATLAVLTILTAGVAGLLAPAINIYVESTNLARSTMVLDNLLTLLAGELTYSTSLELGAEWPDDAVVTGAQTARYDHPLYGTIELSQPEGVLSLQPRGGTGQLSFDASFYMGNTVQIGLVRQGEQAVKINAALFDSRGRHISSQARYVTLLNEAVTGP